MVARPTGADVQCYAPVDGQEAPLLHLSDGGDRFVAHRLEARGECRFAKHVVTPWSSQFRYYLSMTGPDGRIATTSPAPMPGAVWAAVDRQMERRAIAIESRSQAQAAAAEDATTPPFSVLRVIGEIAAGSGIALVMAIPGAAIGRAVDCQGDEACENQEFGPAGLWVGAYMGASLGFALGVYAVGSIGDETGSFWATTLSGVAGGLLGAGLLTTSDDAGGFFLLLPVVGSLTAFNVTREYD